jgi:hypothetical protein
MALGPMGIKSSDYVMDVDTACRTRDHTGLLRGMLERHDRVHVSVSTEVFDEHMKAKHKWTTKRIVIAVDK